MTKIGGMMGTCFLWACAVGVAQNSTVTTVVDVKPNTEKTKRFWEYTITWTGDLAEDKKVGISFKIPKGYTSSKIYGDEKPLGTPQPGGFRRWVFTVSACDEKEKKKKVTMTFSGPKTKLKKNGLVEWIGEYNMAPSGTDVTDGPEPAFDPSRFRFILAAGIGIRANDIVDFKEQEAPSREDPMMMEPFLFTVNDSRVRATALVGGAFRLGKTADKPWEAIASFQFTNNTTRHLDGFFFGLSWGVQKYLSVGGGYSLRLGKELSSGFQRSAAHFVTTEKLEKRFPVSPDMNGLMDDKDYDGLPLTNSMGARWFPGNPIVDSFNHSVFIGLFFPIDISKIIKGAKGY